MQGGKSGKGRSNSRNEEAVNVKELLKEDEDLKDVDGEESKELEENESYQQLFKLMGKLKVNMPIREMLKHV